MGATCGTCFSRVDRTAIERVRRASNRANKKAHTRSIQQFDKAMRNSKNIQLPHANTQQFQASQEILRKSKRKNVGQVVKILDDEYMEASTAVIQEREKTLKDQEVIRKAISEFFIFTTLDEEHIELLINKMKHYIVSPGEIIMEQGKPAINFFVCIQGKLEVIINGERKKLIRQGMGFGELALLHDTTRTATIRTVERVTLWGLDKKTFRDAVQQVNSANYYENRNFIENINLLQLLTPDQKEALLNSLISHNFVPGQNVVNQGDPGDLLYIIKEGTVVVIKDGRELRVMQKGEFFGEQALLYNSVRTATIRATSLVKCLSIKRNNLQAVLGSQLQQIIYRNSQRIAIEKSKILVNLEQRQIENLVNQMDIQSYAKDQVIVEAGQQRGLFLIILLKGRLIGQTSGETIETFTCIDDMYLSEGIDKFHEESLIAESDEIDIAIIERQRFEEAIGGQLTDINQQNETLTALKQVNILKGLSNSQLSSLIRCVNIQFFESEQVIVQQGEMGESLYIIKNGKVDVFRNNAHIRTITKFDYFGERSLLTGEERSATVIAQGPVECWVVQKDDFFELVGEVRRQYFQQRIDTQDLNIGIQDLIPIHLLGKGTTSNVFLVMSKSKNLFFALKAIHRNAISAYELYENLQLERKLLSQLDHSMIMKLVKTFKDRERVYFLTEFVHGFDFFDVLRELNILDDCQAIKYIACLILILQYIHERDIIYRDLKPENIMVDHEGYLKLIDFGTAKILEGRTYTTVGTPQYMAPEVILGKGYGFPADIWSMGIILYECLFGGVPFGENEEDAYSIYEAVLEHKLVYPSKGNKSQAKPLIQQLLSKNPALRTGGNLEKLKIHDFFIDLNWVSQTQEDLEARRIDMPYKPRLRSYDNEVAGMKDSRISLLDYIKVTFIQREEAKNDSDLATRGNRRDAHAGWDDEF